MEKEKTMMNDLISREALQKELAKGMIITDDIYGMGIMAGVRRAQDVVKKLPAVDSVEVVRCKDCKHWQESVDGITKWCPLLMGKATKADDFCSYGERKDK